MYYVKFLEIKKLTADNNWPQDFQDSLYIEAKKF